MAKGERIKGMREKMGYSQTELAEKVKISKQTLYKYENNIVTNIPSDIIEKIASALNCAPGYFMGWEDYPEDGWHDYTPPEGTPTYKVAWPPKQVILSDHEDKVIMAYRKAPEGIQEAVDKLLDIDSEKKKAFSGA